MKLLNATIQKAPRQVTTKYGDRIVTDCKLSDGQEVTLWQPITSTIINYGTGQKITLSVDSKGKYHLVEKDNGTPIFKESEPTKSSELSNAQKREIAEYLTEQTKLFSFCYQQTKLIDNLPDEDRRAVATTLYLQSVKHFCL
ncbi:MAG: hypothetical protein ACKO5Q_28125 [Microcystaceae cyanobacterium]